jgi:hypothetical protein
MSKSSRIYARWIFGLLAFGLIAVLSFSCGRSEPPDVSLQFESITNSLSLGQVARFTLINHGKHAVQRLPLYVIELPDDPQRDMQQVITVAVPPVLQSASSQTIDVPLPQTATQWRLGVSCSQTGLRPRLRNWRDTSRSYGVPANAPLAFAYKIRSRVLDMFARGFPATYVYVQSEWVNDHRRDP